MIVKLGQVRIRRFRPLITRKFCICNSDQSITHHILRLLKYFTIICDMLTKLLHLLKVHSLGYKNKKLMLWGLGLVPGGNPIGKVLVILKQF